MKKILIKTHDNEGENIDNFYIKCDECFSETFNVLDLAEHQEGFEMYYECSKCGTRQVDYLSENQDCFLEDNHSTRVY